MEKIRVVLIQDATARIVRVRIGEVEIPVMHAGLVPGLGRTNLALTVENIDHAYELAAPVVAGQA